jgi:hypothetical protein
MKCSSRNSYAFFTGAALLLFLPVSTLNAVPQSADSQLPQGDPVLGDRITGGVVFEGKLWLRGAIISREDVSGGLVSLNLADESRRVQFERGVLDIKKADHDLWVMRRTSLADREFVLSVWRKDKFEDLAMFSSSKKDEPIALVNTARGPTVLCMQTIRMLAADDRTWKLVKLKGKLRGGFQVTVASPLSGNSIYVGFNTGEWGGGLQRVDLRTGVVTNVERRETKELCAGPLNSDCDPVTGVIPDPRNKDCVLATVGLVHMLSHGWILRVCGENVSLVFEKSEMVDDFRGGKMKMTEAFFGLVSAEYGGFWGINSEALYRFGADGNIKEEHALPKLKRLSGFLINRELPGVIVLGTDANWAVSVSGYTPLVIPLADAQPERGLNQ